MKKKLFTDLFLIMLVFGIGIFAFAGCSLIFHTHNYTEKTVAPTCQSGGYILYQCSCGDSYKEMISAPIPHRYTSKTIAPTCEESGYTAYTCSTCGESYKETAARPLGHTTETIVGSNATCTQTGLTDGLRCTVCGKTIQEQAVISKLPHKDTQHDGYCDDCDTQIEKVVDIRSVAELKAIGGNMSGSYRLMNDISLEGENWIALGSDKNPFTGNFYGMGHTISGLTLSNQKESGLFLYNCGVIEGLGLKNTSCSLKDMNGTMGGIAVYNKGKIADCSIVGDFNITCSVYHYEKTG